MENEFCEGIQQSPLTFLSKKKSDCPEPLKVPNFLENEKMKSLNTFSTENPISPYVKDQKLNLISFSSIELAENAPKTLNSENFSKEIYQRRRINSEVITTSVEKNKEKPTNSNLPELNNINISKNKSRIINLKKRKLKLKIKLKPTPKNQKSSRSLSVFLISSRREDSANSSFLDDFRQEEHKKKIGSFVDSNLYDPFKIRNKGSLIKKNLKVHYFKCCLEQLMDGWEMKRGMVQARRKNTAPLFK